MESNMNSGGKLAWAVLAQRPDGKSEVIKVTDHIEADQTVKDNPNLYYKLVHLCYLKSTKEHPRPCSLPTP